MMYPHTAHCGGDDNFSRFAIFPIRNTNCLEIENSFNSTPRYVFIQILDCFVEEPSRYFETLSFWEDNMRRCNEEQTTFPSPVIGAWNWLVPSCLVFFVIGVLLSAFCRIQSRICWSRSWSRVLCFPRFSSGSSPCPSGDCRRFRGHSNAFGGALIEKGTLWFNLAISRT
jgi:hypothetical protein